MKHVIFNMLRFLPPEELTIKEHVGELLLAVHFAFRVLDEKLRFLCWATTRLQLATFDTSVVSMH